MIFTSQPKCIWVMNKEDIPNTDEPIENGSSNIDKYKVGNDYYYVLRYSNPINPDEIPVESGGNKICKL